MTEEDARHIIQVALNRLRDNRSVADEAVVSEGDTTVDYHIDNIVKSGDGEWNETIARDYIQNLEAQIEQELTSSDAEKR